MNGPGASQREPGTDERGFALLMVFLMAAVIALYLYTQLPRVAFETEREKEQTLIDRGEQYKRAIQLYVLAVKKYPQKIEDLENTNEKRYLRKRYIDPMTGKDEWRLIHVNAAGLLTDSLVQKPPAAPGDPSSPTGAGAAGTATGASTVTTNATGAGANGAPATPPDPNDVNAAVRKRPSDVVGQAYTQPANADPNDPSTWAPITVGTPGTANGQPPTGAVGFNGGLLGQNAQAPGVNGQNGQPQTLGMPVAGGFPLPGQPGFNPAQNQFKIDANGQLVPVTPAQPQPQTSTNLTANSQTAQTTPLPSGIQGGVNPAGNGIAAQNAATSAIQSMLTNPNPVAGANGLGTAAGMSTGGIAGVASTYKGTSIKTYGGRQKYQEWEFIFSLNNQQNGANGQNRNPLQNGQPGQNGTGTGSGTTTGTGTTTGAPSTTGNQE